MLIEALGKDTEAMKAFVVEHTTRLLRIKSLFPELVASGGFDNDDDYDAGY